MNLKTVGHGVRSTGQFIYYFRKVFLAIPVIVAALLIARYAGVHLPEQVGLILGRDGSFTMMLGRGRFILGSMLITGGCLLLMFFSRKIFYPWIISIVTLLFPAVIILLNQFF